MLLWLYGGYAVLLLVRVNGCLEHVYECTRACGREGVKVPLPPLPAAPAATRVPACAAVQV